MSTEIIIYREDIQEEYSEKSMNGDIRHFR